MPPRSRGQLASDPTARAEPAAPRARPRPTRERRPPAGPQAKLGARAARRRAAILAAAEAIFAERGFAATRLEDVAARVGIRRASLVYYFRDKRELYDAVVSDVLGGLLTRSRDALGGPEPLAERLEAAVRMFVDYLGDRPALAGLLLREIADGPAERHPALRRHARPFLELVERLLAERGRSGDAGARLDAAHFASAIAGVTVFFSAVGARGRSRAAGAGVHRDQVIEVARRLLALEPARAGGSDQTETAARGDARRRPTQETAT